MVMLVVFALVLPLELSMLSIATVVFAFATVRAADVTMPIQRRLVLCFLDFTHREISMW